MTRTWRTGRRTSFPSHSLVRLVLLCCLGLFGTASIAQVRPLVLEDPSRTVPAAPPPRLPPRRASFQQIWEIEMGGRIVDGFLGGPGGVVYATHEGAVRMIAPGDGSLLWERHLDAPPETRPTGIDGRLFVATSRSLHALATRDGSLLWTATLPVSPAAAAAADGHLVVVPLTSGELVAFQPLSGETRWRTALNCTATAPAGLRAGLVTVGCREGDVVALARDSGEIRWRRATDAPVATPAWLSEKSVHVATDDGRVMALGLRKGHRRYTARVGSRPGPFLVAGGRLLLVGALDNLLYAFRTKGGHLAWSADIGTRPVSPPTVWGDLAMVAPLLATQIVAIDIRDGAILAREPVAGEDRHSASGPVFAGPVLVVATKPVAGGAGWLTGYTVDVEEQPRPLFPSVGVPVRR